MPLRTKLTEKLGIRHPILLAPMGTASGGTLAKAVTEGGGLGIVVAQGTEAGGHGATRSTLALVPAVVDAVRERNDEVVVVAAGGIADGRGLAAALTLGAQGALLGTPFPRLRRGADFGRRQGEARRSSRRRYHPYARLRYRTEPRFAPPVHRAGGAECAFPAVARARHRAGQKSPR